MARKDLLDQFAALLVSPKSHRGAKGRLARRLYSILAKLQLRGLVTQEAGMVKLSGRTRKGPGPVTPELGPILERLLFKALLAEDGQGAGHTPSDLLKARQGFIFRALETGWSLDASAAVLGVTTPQAAQIMAEGRAAKKK
jgi:hypothetical protein